MRSEAARRIDEAVTRGLAGRREFRVRFLYGLDGEIVPCGCSDGQRGGLLKTSTALKALHAVAPGSIVFLGENHLGTTIPESRFTAAADYYRRRVSFVEDALLQLNPNSMVLGKFEATVMSRLGFPSNGKKIATLAKVGEPGEEVSVVVRPPGTEELDSSPSLGAALPDASAGWLVTLQVVIGRKGPRLHLSVAFSSLGAVTTSPSVDLPLTERGGREVGELTLYLPRVQGAGFKLVDMAEVNAIRRVSQQVTDGSTRLLGSLEQKAEATLNSHHVLYSCERKRVGMSVADDPDTLTRYQGFLTSASMVESRTSFESPAAYVGECSSCHKDKAEFFLAQDKHSHAFDTLRKLSNGSHNDPHCQSCHTTSRFVPIGEEPGFVRHEGVLCGSCHLNTEAHARNPRLVSTVAVSAPICATCHTSSQSPKYNYRAYLEKIACVQHRAGRTSGDRK